MNAACPAAGEGRAARGGGLIGKRDELLKIGITPDQRSGRRFHWSTATHAGPL
jgi:hypothetical protein